MADDPVTSMLTKLAAFSRALTAEEREALTALVAPGVELVLDVGADEVEAFGFVVWTTELLADNLRRVLDERSSAPPTGTADPHAAPREADP